jgi:hypothetical protein
MRSTAAAAGVLLGLGLAVPGAAAGAESVTYEGTFGGPVETVGCEPAYGPMQAGGTWRVIVANHQAVARFAITVNGEPHVTYTAPMDLLPTAPREAFRITVQTGAGPLVVSLKGRTLRYQIAPYDFSAWGGSVCSSVTYYGQLG